MTPVAEMLAALAVHPIATDPRLSFEFFSDLSEAGPTVYFYREHAKDPEGTTYDHMASVWHDGRRRRWGWSLGPDAADAAEQGSETTPGDALYAVGEGLRL